MLTPEVLERMIQEARRVQRRAHAPYSNFHVGAAILTETGRIITGCNVENASYGLTICAERNAIARCVAEDAGQPIACVVVGPTEEPLTPCGACRQVLLEFNPDMTIVCISETDVMADYRMKDLLPHSFNSSALE